MQLYRFLKYGSVMLETRTHKSQGFAWPCFGYRPKDSSDQFSSGSAASRLGQTWASSRTVHPTLLVLSQGGRPQPFRIPFIYGFLNVKFLLQFGVSRKICLSPGAQC